ncbi:putative ribosomal recycling factor, mitochondrial [Schizosaccharomyces pombe]
MFRIISKATLFQDSQRLHTSILSPRCAFHNGGILHKKAKDKDVKHDHDPEFANSFNKMLKSFEAKMQLVHEKLAKRFQEAVVLPSQGNFTQLEALFIPSKSIKAPTPSRLLREIAAVSQKGSQQIIIRPFEDVDIKNILKAIEDSRYPFVANKLNASTIEVKPQRTTLESRQQLAKVLEGYAKDSREQLSAMRTELKKEIAKNKKSKAWTSDDCYKAEAEMQTAFKNAINLLDSGLKSALKKVI